MAKYNLKDRHLNGEKTTHQIRPFEFKQCIAILKATGKKASTIKELRNGISEVSDECIFHHVYQYFLKGHILEYTNDFAQWIAHFLEERALAEQLSNLDPYMFRSINDVRKELLRIIDAFLRSFPEPRPALPGNEFYFSEALTIVFPCGIKARNLAEFLVAIKNIDVESIYYHFYEARMRLGGGVDDFSRWIEESLERNALSNKIRNIDPFMHNLDGIREQIAEYVEEDLKTEMEAS
jgi:hypothetical protein